MPRDRITLAALFAALAALSDAVAVTVPAGSRDTAPVSYTHLRAHET